MQKQEWTQKSLRLTQKTAHSANIIGISPHSQQTFLTSSEDATVRLWDLRLQSSVKLIRHESLSSELSLPATDGDTRIYIGSECSLLEFDARKQLVFVEEIVKKIQQPHYDCINQVKFSQQYGEVLGCDDEGDIRAYKKESLENIHRLQQHHTNICNAIEYVYSDHKQLLEKKLCVSGGFDCNLILWDMAEEKPLKKVPMKDIFLKYGIKSQNQNEPFIHSIATHRNSIIVGLETGHIICSPAYELRKPKFILEASLTRIVSCSIWGGPRPILLSADNSDSFCLFDFEQRVDGKPKFLQKYRAPGEPVQIQPLATHLLLATVSPTLSFYELKQ